VKRAAALVLLAAGLLLVAAALFLSLHAGGGAGAPFPPSLAGLPLSSHLTGADAVASIQQLHGRQFPMADGVVAVYGEGSAVLWVSLAVDEAAAAELAELMRVRIAAGQSPFVEQGVSELDGITLHALDGMGQRHFYWQSGALVLWLAADESTSGQALLDAVAFYRQAWP